MSFLDGELLNRICICYVFKCTFRNSIMSFDQTHSYARWSLGFVDPPLEISGKGDSCTITALNLRGQVLLKPVMDAMEKLNTEGLLSSVKIDGDVVHVKVAPPAEVGTFSEEERSKQVGDLCDHLSVCSACNRKCIILTYHTHLSAIVIFSSAFLSRLIWL